MRYYISDLHFWHERIIDFDKREFDCVENMNEFMIRQWNKRVNRGDEVVVVGDFAIGTSDQINSILDQLKGRIYLIAGNHDKFIKISDVKIERFESIRPYAEMNDNKRKVILCHYPIVCYNSQFRMDEKGNAKTYMVHGHVHNTPDIIGLRKYKDFVSTYLRTSKGVEEKRAAPCNIINCFCVNSNYVPLTLDEWIELDKKRVDEKKTLELIGKVE